MGRRIVGIVHGNMFVVRGNADGLEWWVPARNERVAAAVAFAANEIVLGKGIADARAYVEANANKHEKDLVSAEELLSRARVELQ